MLRLLKWLVENQYVCLPNYPLYFFKTSSFDPTNIVVINGFNILTCGLPILSSSNFTNLSHKQEQQSPYEGFVDAFTYLTCLVVVKLVKGIDTRALISAGLIVASRHKESIKYCLVNILLPFTSGDPKLGQILNNLRYLDFNQDDFQSSIQNVK